MKFVDQVKVHLRSGRGGDGCASLRREKFVPRGGPDGGDGGDGAGIVFQGDKAKTTLLDFQFRQHIHAPDGRPGQGKAKHGRKANSLVLQVPLGTVVKAAESGEVLVDVVDETPRLCLPGGGGGKGNMRFRTSTHRVPMEAEEGQPGTALWVTLELKLMADVGLVGLPNAGKSTLISRISQARPKIADYPFSTLVPELGVVQGRDWERFVVADIPGIIRGAHQGAGLGLRFLRHIERTALLLLLIDGSGMSGEKPLEEYEVLLEEMSAFSSALPRKPRAVALTKIDTLSSAEQSEQVDRFRNTLERRGERVFPISAVAGSGLETLITFLAEQVAALRR